MALGTLPDIGDQDWQDYQRAEFEANTQLHEQRLKFYQSVDPQIEAFGQVGSPAAAAGAADLSQPAAPAAPTAPAGGPPLGGAALPSADFWNVESTAPTAVAPPSVSPAAPASTPAPSAGGGATPLGGAGPSALGIAAQPSGQNFNQDFWSLPAAPAPQTITPPSGPPPAVPAPPSPAAPSGDFWKLESSPTVTASTVGTLHDPSPPVQTIGTQIANSPNESGQVFPLAGLPTNKPDQTYHLKGGSDLMAPRGTPVLNMQAGTVSEVFTDNGSHTVGGNAVLIHGNDGLDYYYAHFDQPPSLKPGQRVDTGVQIGAVGNSGNAWKDGKGETHLHIGIGHGISNGVGAEGGLGQDYDAQALLAGLASGVGKGQTQVAGRPVNTSFAPTTAEISGGGPATAGLTARAQQIMSGAADAASWLGSEGQKALQAVLVTEGGMNNARGDKGASAGPLQFYEKGQLANIANALGLGLEQAKTWVEQNPGAAVQWAVGTPDKPGYIGQAIQRGLSQGLSGADLATYVQRTGQVSVSPERAGENYNALFGDGSQPLRGGVQPPSQQPAAQADTSTRQYGATQQNAAAVGNGTALPPDPVSGLLGGLGSAFSGVSDAVGGAVGGAVDRVRQAVTGPPSSTPVTDQAAQAEAARTSPTGAPTVTPEPLPVVNPAAPEAPRAQVQTASTPAAAQAQMNPLQSLGQTIADALGGYLDQRLGQAGQVLGQANDNLNTAFHQGAEAVGPALTTIGNAGLTPPQQAERDEAYRQLQEGNYDPEALFRPGNPFGGQPAIGATPPSGVEQYVRGQQQKDAWIEENNPIRDTWLAGGVTSEAAKFVSNPVNLIAAGLLGPVGGTAGRALLEAGAPRLAATVTDAAIQGGLGNLIAELASNPDATPQSAAQQFALGAGLTAAIPLGTAGARRAMSKLLDWGTGLIDRLPTQDVYGRERTPQSARQLPEPGEPGRRPYAEPQPGGGLSPEDRATLGRVREAPVGPGPRGQSLAPQVQDALADVSDQVRDLNIRDPQQTITRGVTRSGLAPARATEPARSGQLGANLPEIQNPNLKTLREGGGHFDQSAGGYTIPPPSQTRMVDYRGEPVRGIAAKLNYNSDIPADLQDPKADEFSKAIRANGASVASGDWTPEQSVLSAFLTKVSIQRPATSAEKLRDAMGDEWMLRHQPSIQPQAKATGGAQTYGMTIRPETVAMHVMGDTASPEAMEGLAALGGKALDELPAGTPAYMASYATRAEREAAARSGVDYFFSSVKKAGIGKMTDPELILHEPIVRKGVASDPSSRRPWLDSIPELHDLIMEYGQQRGRFAGLPERERRAKLLTEIMKTKVAGIGRDKSAFPAAMGFDPGFGITDSRIKNVGFGLSAKQTLLPAERNMLQDKMVARMMHGDSEYVKQWLGWAYMLGEKTDYTSIARPYADVARLFGLAREVAQRTNQPYGPIAGALSEMVQQIPIEYPDSPEIVRARVGVSPEAMKNLPPGMRGDKLKKALPELEAFANQAGVTFVDDPRVGLGHGIGPEGPVTEGAGDFVIQGTRAAIRWFAAAWMAANPDEESAIIIITGPGNRGTSALGTATITDDLRGAEMARLQQVLTKFSPYGWSLAGALDSKTGQKSLIVAGLDESVVAYRKRYNQFVNILKRNGFTVKGVTVEPAEVEFVEQSDVGRILYGGPTGARRIENQLGGAGTGPGPMESGGGSGAGGPPRGPTRIPGLEPPGRGPDRGGGPESGGAGARDLRGQEAADVGGGGAPPEGPPPGGFDAAAPDEGGGPDLGFRRQEGYVQPGFATRIGASAAGGGAGYLYGQATLDPNDPDYNAKLAAYTAAGAGLGLGTGSALVRILDRGAVRAAGRTAAQAAGAAAEDLPRAATGRRAQAAAANLSADAQKILDMAGGDVRRAMGMLEGVDPTALTEQGRRVLYDTYQQLQTMQRAGIDNLPPFGTGRPRDMPTEGRNPRGSRPIDSTPAEEVDRLRLDHFPEDVRQTIEDNAADINFGRDQRRGVIGDREAERMASAYAKNTSLDDLIKSARAGQAYNTEEIRAVRNATAAQAVKVNDAADVLAQAGKQATPAQFQKFAIEQQKLQRLIEIAEGQRAEAGRALRAYSNNVRFEELRPEDALKELTRAFKGDRSALLDGIAEYRKLVDSGAGPIQLAQFWNAIQNPLQWHDWLKVWRYNSMLSGPRTLEANTVGNGIEIMYRTMRNTMLDVSRAGGHAALGDFAAAGRDLSTTQKEWLGISAGLDQANRRFWEVMRSGITSEQAAAGEFGLGISNRVRGSGTGANVQRGIATGLEMPGRLMAAIDQWGDAIAYNMAYGRLAAQKASSEGLSGRLWSDRVSQLIANKSIDPALMRQADSIAERTLFHGEMGQTGKALEAMVTRMPQPLGHFILPFMRTVYHITSRGVDRSPLGLAATLFDVAKGNYGRGSELGKALSAAKGPGGAQVPLGERLADGVLGTLAFYSMYQYATSVDPGGVPNITGAGPDDQQDKALLRSQGWQPFSIKMGDRWVPYSQWGPFALPMAAVGGLADARAAAKPGDHSAKRVADAVGSFIQLLPNQTYLQGIGDLLDAAKEPERYGPAYVQSLIGSLIPYGGTLNAIGDASDNVLRKPNPINFATGDFSGIPQAAMARIPGLRSSVPAAQDIFGNAAVNPRGGWNAVNYPLSSLPVGNDPAVEEMRRLDVRPPGAPMTITRNGQPVVLTASEQQQIQADAGDRIEKFVRQSIGDPGWANKSDAAKRQRLDDIITAQREVAEDVWLRSLDKDELRRRRAEGKAARQPAAIGGITF